VGQQTHQTSKLKAAMEPDHVKNSKSRSEMSSYFPSETKGKSTDFPLYGMAVRCFLQIFRP
jgi:hypothetical protein